MDTLALSDNYTPIRRMAWQDAICAVLAGRAEVLEEYADRFIHTVSEKIAMPSVIRFVSKVSAFLFRRKARFNRKNIWVRDGGKCQYCGRKESLSSFTYDHVVPIAQGGITCWTNIVVACMPCNQRKGDRTPLQAGMRLLTKPVVPTSVPTCNVFVDPLPETWKDYLGSYQYWHGSLTT